MCSFSCSVVSTSSEHWSHFIIIECLFFIDVLSQLLSQVIYLMSLITLELFIVGWLLMVLFELLAMVCILLILVLLYNLTLQLVYRFYIFILVLFISAFFSIKEYWKCPFHCSLHLSFGCLYQKTF